MAVLGAAVLLGGLICAGRLMRDPLRVARRYQYPFQQIDCPAPPGTDRGQFLGEVRYYGEFDESVSLLDEDLPRRLSEAFARHAWVEKVERVEITPERRIQVTLTFRTPVLAIVYNDGGPIVRAVDRQGILLPRAVDTLLLPHLAGRADPPGNGAGKPWGSPQVEEAAKVAGLLYPHRSKLKLTEFRWQEQDLRLLRESGQVVLWGRPPGAEPPGQPSAERKIVRLLEGVEVLDPKIRIDLRTE